MKTFFTNYSIGLLFAIVLSLCGCDEPNTATVGTGATVVVNVDPARFKLEQIATPSPFPDIFIFTDIKTHKEIVTAYKSGAFTVLEVNEDKPLIENK